MCGRRPREGALGGCGDPSHWRLCAQEVSLPLPPGAQPFTFFRTTNSFSAVGPLCATSSSYLGVRETEAGAEESGFGSHPGQALLGVNWRESCKRHPILSPLYFVHCLWAQPCPSLAYST